MTKKQLALTLLVVLSEKQSIIVVKWIHISLSLAFIHLFAFPFPSLSTSQVSRNKLASARRRKLPFQLSPAVTHTHTRSLSELFEFRDAVALHISKSDILAQVTSPFKR